jgi:hypothetical protein
MFCAGPPCCTELACEAEPYTDSDAGQPQEAKYDAADQHDHGKEVVGRLFGGDPLDLHTAVTNKGHGLASSWLGIATYSTAWEGDQRGKSIAGQTHLEQQSHQEHKSCQEQRQMLHKVGGRPRAPRLVHPMQNMRPAAHHDSQRHLSVGRTSATENDVS